MSPPPGGRKRKGRTAGCKKSTASDSQARSGRAASTLRARRLAGAEGWELVHPRCARDRSEDLEEVRKMVAADEIDVAVDECRWLLSGCSDCLEAHQILGEIALADDDLPLARGHFGYAYRLGEKALAEAGSRGPVLYSLPANRAFLESGKALAWCLLKLDKREMAAEVIAFIRQCDPSDPLGVAGLNADRPN